MIRRADLRDAPAVLELWGQARSPAAVTSDTEEAVQRLIEQPGSQLLLAELDAEREAVELWLSAGYERDEQISRFVHNLSAGSAR